jgi:hypothetical protein
LTEEPQGRGVEASSQLRLLPHFLRDTSQARALYVLKAWLLSFIGSIPLALAVSGLAESPPSPEFGATGGGLIFMLVLVAPALETLLMTPPLILDRLFGPIPAILGSALGWGVAHSLAEPGWGLVIWWPFLVFSTILLVWRPLGLGKAMLMVIAVHGLQNAVPAISLLVSP